MARKGASGPLSDGKLVALTLLNQARDDAEDARQEVWQFAIRKAVLVTAGATESDLRWLLSRRLIDQAGEITKRGDSERKFSKLTGLNLPENGCFILSYAGKAYVEQPHLPTGPASSKLAATIGARVARAGDRKRRREPIAADDAGTKRKATKQQHRVRSVTDARSDRSPILPPTSMGDGKPGALDVPEWRAIEGKLYFRGELARRRGRKAARVEEFLLGAFAQADWAQAILIHFPSGPIESPEQVKEAVRRLNDHMLIGSLRFHVHHDGEIVSWEDLARANTRG